jgi:hypothetical protein
MSLIESKIMSKKPRGSSNYLKLNPNLAPLVLGCL